MRIGDDLYDVSVFERTIDRSDSVVDTSMGDRISEF